MSSELDGTITEKQDLDFWYNPTYTNYFNLLFALKDLGYDVQVFLDEQTPTPKKSFFKFQEIKFTLDFLQLLDGIDSFRKSYENKMTSYIGEIEISIISFEDLIISKTKTGRKKDFDDINKLNDIRNRN